MTTTTAANPVLSNLIKSTSAAAQAAKDAAGKVDEDPQNRFLTLLVNQMKNQDPLNPLDNAEVTSQLAQLSTVTGIDKLNETMKSMMESSANAQALQAANMIGHGVLVSGSALTLSGSKSIYGVELSAPADSVQVTINDGAGNPVRTVSLGPQQPGTLALAWDGSLASGGVAPDGNYQITVNAVRGGASVSANALTFGEVVSVSTNASGAKLNLAGGKAPVALGDIRQIL